MLPLFFCADLQVFAHAYDPSRKQSGYGLNMKEQSEAMPVELNARQLQKKFKCAQNRLVVNCAGKASFIRHCRVKNKKGANFLHLNIINAADKNYTFNPPQTLRVCPVTYEPISLARNNVVLAISSPVPKRASGMRFKKLSAASPSER